MKQNSNRKKPPTSQTIKKLNKRNILVVDDDPFLLTTLGEELEAEGFQVETVKSGEDALEILNRTAFDLVITDMVMLGINGIQVLENVKYLYPETMVIILTGYGDMHSAIQAIRLDADDYIVKPCTSEELFFRIQRCCEKLELQETINRRKAELEELNRKLLDQIAEREFAEKSLRESEEKYSTLVEDSLTGVYIIQDGKIEFANQRFAEIYGYSREDLIGMDSLQIVHPKDRALVKTLREKRLKGEETPACYEIRGMKKNGETIWIERSHTLIKYRDRLAIAGNAVETTHRKQIEEALRNSEMELRNLSRQLLMAGEIERRRIARELHDGLGQALTAIKYSAEISLKRLAHLDNSAGVEFLEKIISETQSATKEVREIIQALRPRILDDLGILATINWICREFQAIYSGIVVEKEVAVKEVQVPDVLKTVIFRIVQEAFNNVSKHSRATHVYLKLKKNENSLCLEVWDNGIGFNKEKTLTSCLSEGCFGISSMRERAELSGGDFLMETKPSAGTRITVIWELSSSEEPLVKSG